MKIRLLIPAVAMLLLASACGDDDDAGEATPALDRPVTVTLMTHDSFNVTDSVLDAFADESGIRIEVLRAGDAGSMVNQAILSASNPQADVLFGIDNTFLSRALDADLFVPYESPRLEFVDDSLELDDEHRVTPIDTGDVCLNYDIAALAAAELEPPASLDDLTTPAYKGTLVVENPATSSPGLAFLLATVSAFGEDGWQDFWERLADNDLAVAAGWEEAYYGQFSRSGGDRPLVVSYASSPPAEIIFAEEPLDEAPTAALLDSCFRQIEFAGILDGTDDLPAAKAVVDFLLSDEFQADMPSTMFVYPVVDVALPPEFEQYGPAPASPFSLDPATIAENRDEWIDQWTDIVLR